MRRLVMLLATWFGSGLSPVASGTFGTLAAIPFYLLLSKLSLPLYLTATAIFTIFSCIVSEAAEKEIGVHDSGKIVIDEVAGYLVTMTAITPTFSHIITGFFLFRLFDIVKPPPANWIDKGVKNGAGVVLDDVAAGVYASLTLHLLARYL